MITSSLCQLTSDTGQFFSSSLIHVTTLVKYKQSLHSDNAFPNLSPCGCGDLSVRLGSRISPHRNRVVVEVHWRGAQGWRSISWVVATFNHVGGSFNLSMAATGDVWIIPSFRIWGYVLHVEHISCVITNCGQLQWAIPSLFSIAL